MKNVINVFGETFCVDDENEHICSYYNKKKQILANAEIINERGEHTGFYTDYTKEGTVDDIETKIRASFLIAPYADAVEFYADKNDPDRKIWKKYVLFIKINADKIFDPYGDVKKGFDIKFNKDGKGEVLFNVR